MFKKFFTFYKNSFHDFFEAVYNITLFFPYFFSVVNLLKTLFYPWKNLSIQKTRGSFSLKKIADNLFFNLVSRFIGFGMRFSLLIFYFFIQLIFLASLPILFILFLFSLPFVFIWSLFEKSDEEKKTLLKNNFVKQHLLREENRQKVELWFEEYYSQYVYRLKCWKVKNLFSIPPLARDWSSGYTPVLNNFCDELTSSSYQSKTKNIMDREKEIDQIERFLIQTNESNVIVSGEEGVGKHTIIDALAKRIYEGQTTSQLVYKRILKLNIEKISTKYTDPKQRESFFEELFEEAGLAGNVILLIENIDRYLTYSEGKIDLSGPIEKYIRNNNIQIIAITTPFLYQKYIFTNEKISHFFNKVDVYEINKSEAEKILKNSALFFEKKYKIGIPFEIISSVIEKSDFYITYIPFPEKAIDLLDSACIFAKEKLKLTVVTPTVVERVLAEKTHAPVNFDDTLRLKILDFDKILSSKIVGQEEAIAKISSVIRRAFLLIGKRKKPLASFIFFGPTGVGKTETAKTISEIFFGKEKDLVRFDMSLYQSKEDIPKLIGSIETHEPGLMAQAIRENPFAVLLLDEIEKSNKDLINIFLTVIDEGYFTDSHGKKIDCKNLIIIATSNAGSNYIFQKNLKNPDFSTSDLINYLIEERLFSPEFLNRFDGVINYKPLTPETIFQLAKFMINKIAKDLFALYRVRIEIEDNLLTNLANKNYDPKFGARNMERLIRENIEDKISRIILAKKVKEGDTIHLKAEFDNLSTY